MRQYKGSAVRVAVIAMGLSVSLVSSPSWAKPVESTPSKTAVNGAVAVPRSVEGSRTNAQTAQRGEPLERNNTTTVPAEERGLVIREYLVEGNTILSEEQLNEILNKHKGDKKTIKDIEKARGEVEKAYHDLGYPTVLVVVPEQTIESGTVRILVVEGKVEQIAVTDNRYYSRYNILGKLPSIKIGEILREKDLVKELDALNANPDLKVVPLLKPGSEQGLVNVELKTKDRLPLHVSVQGDNQGSVTTPRDRLTVQAQYTNLWDRDHILNIQTIQTPTDWGKVQTYGISYVAPIRWPDHLFSVYYSHTQSTSALASASLGVGGGDVSIAGNATVAGFRYSFPLFSSPKSVHQLSIGADFKRLEETTATFPAGLGTATVLTPIQYTPVSAAYNAAIVDDWGQTRLSATAKGYASVVPGGKEDDFAQIRKGSTGTFAVLQGSLERSHDLPWGMNLLLHADGQWASQPLVVTEQYFAGGMDTVRGYIQYETLGDESVRGRAELTTPDLLPIPIDRIWQRRRSSDWEINWKLAAFYDAANLWVKDAPQGQRDQFRIESTGWGLRVRMPKNYGTVRIDQGFALQNGTVTQRGDTFVHFVVNVAY